MKKIILSLATTALAASAVTFTGGAAIAMPVGDRTSSSTTLDACGYFVGTQITKNESVKDGVTTDRGSFTGVTNNYGGGPVASLGPVKGTFVETSATDVNGNVTGTESFSSSSGKIDQTFSYDAVTNTWSVSVTASGDLSFLTSDTIGHCYTGTFPRP